MEQLPLNFKEEPRGNFSQENEKKEKEITSVEEMVDALKKNPKYKDWGEEAILEYARISFRDRNKPTFEPMHPKTVDLHRKKYKNENR